jgi:hypothetical protein
MKMGFFGRGAQRRSNLNPYGWRLLRCTRNDMRRVAAARPKALPMADAQTVGKLRLPLHYRASSGG